VVVSSQGRQVEVANYFVQWSIGHCTLKKQLIDRSEHHDGEGGDMCSKYNQELQLKRLVYPKRTSRGFDQLQK
jgi:hypothetical protein